MNPAHSAQGLPIDYCIKILLTGLFPQEQLIFRTLVDVAAVAQWKKKSSQSLVL